MWRARAGTVGALLLKFRLKFARGPCAAKVAVALCGEYDKVGYDATWRLLRSGAPEAQYGAARLEPGGTDEYGRRQRRSSLTDRNLAMRLVSMSEALAFAEHCGAGMERELRKNRCVSMCALARSLSHAHSCAAYPSPLATARHRPPPPVHPCHHPHEGTPTRSTFPMRKGASDSSSTMTRPTPRRRPRRA